MRYINKNLYCSLLFGSETLKITPSSQTSTDQSYTSVYILPLVLYRCRVWSLTLREQHILQESAIKALTKTYEPEEYKVRRCRFIQFFCRSTSWTTASRMTDGDSRIKIRMLREQGSRKWENRTWFVLIADVGFSDVETIT